MGTVASVGVCYKSKPLIVTKDDILKALNDKIIKEKIKVKIPYQDFQSSKERLSVSGLGRIISQEATKQTTQAKTEERNGSSQIQKITRGGNLTPHLQMETVGDGNLNNNSMALNKTQTLGSTGQSSYFNNIIQGMQRTTDIHKISNHSQIENIINPQSMSDEEQSQLQIRILSYFGAKEKVYDTLSQLSRQSLSFMRQNHQKMERQLTSHQNQRARLVQAKSIEEHLSGVNQIVKLSSREVVTASDDCCIKYWSVITTPPKSSNVNIHHNHPQNFASIKADLSLPTETITCLAATGSNILSQYGTPKKEYLLAGCHSGNLLVIQNSSVKVGIQPQQVKKEQINTAHYNLIRVIVSLENLKNRFFATADVCGIVKIWSSIFKPVQMIEFDLQQAMSYNSLIELQNVLPQKDPTFADSAMIACALKCQKIHIIVVMPELQQYQKIRTITTDHQKPTCLIQLSSKHIAVAVGSLREPAKIEIHSINNINNTHGKSLISVLQHHQDMIDSIIKIQLPIGENEKNEKTSPYVQWLISASRDRQLVLWKLYDGIPLRRTQINLSKSHRKTAVTPHSSQLLSGRISAEDYLRNRSYFNNRKSSQGAIDETPTPANNAIDDNEEETPLIQRVEKSENEKLKLKKRKVQEEENKKDENIEEEQSSEYEYESEVDSQVRQVIEQASNRHHYQIDNSPLLDYFYSLDSGHKDFVRSMIQTNSDQTLITASEDKTIKLFNITTSAI